MPDSFPFDRLEASSRRPFVITPNDSSDLPYVTKAIRAPGDGVIMMVGVDGGPPVPHPVLEGERVDVRVVRVLAAGTTVVGTIIGYA
jgi:hypothetical protein